MSDPTDLLRQLAERSERKLRSPKNLAKGSWIRMTDEQVRTRIMDEIVELADALNIEITGWYVRPLFSGTDGVPDWDAVADEAADVYHFAGMGADLARRRTKR